MRAPLAIALLSGTAAVAIVAACSSFGTSSPDSTTSDSGVPKDPSDAPTATDAGTFICPDGAFCDDFERDTDVALNWSNQHTNNGGLLSIVPDDRRPGGRSFGISITPTKDGTSAALIKNNKASSMRVSFAFRVTTPPSDDVIVVQIFAGDEFAYAILHEGKLGITAEGPKTDGGNPNGEAWVDTILGTVWHDVSFAYVANSSKIVLVVDKNPPAEVPLSRALGAIDSVELGATYARSGGSASFKIDDVRIETQF